MARMKLARETDEQLKSDKTTAVQKPLMDKDARKE